MPKPEVQAAVTLDEIRSWPPMVSVVDAARALGISRSYAFTLAQRGEFPVQCVRVGTRYRVLTAKLLELIEG